MYAFCLYHASYYILVICLRQHETSCMVSLSHKKLSSANLCLSSRRNTVQALAHQPALNRISARYSHTPRTD